MEHTRSYLERGRNFADLAPDKLQTEWVGAAQAFFGREDRSRVRDFNDFDTEYRLRKQEAPLYLIKDAMKAASARTQNLTQKDFERTRKRIEGFLEDLGKAKNWVTAEADPQVRVRSWSMIGVTAILGVFALALSTMATLTNSMIARDFRGLDASRDLYLVPEEALRIVQYRRATSLFYHQALAIWILFALMIVAILADRFLFTAR
jgi:hypothetical protein